MAERPSLTLVVPTYQRREPLLRLLESLRPEFARDGAGSDVLVVVDGSTDGTAEAVDGLGYPVPLSVLRQANAGLAAARNAGLAAARGAIVWFLDDDMTASPGLVARHRDAHRDGPPRLVIGPCLLPPDVAAAPAVREWASEKHAELERRERLAGPAYFSAANTSGPRQLWLAVGGFDPAFVGWGGEDYEIAVRLLAGGVEVGYLPEAVAWHMQERDVAAFLATKRDEGRNTVRIVRKHPDTAAELLAPRGDRASRLVHAVAGVRPRAYAGAARAAAVAAGAAPRRARRLLDAAARLSFAAGVAELDPGYLRRLVAAEPSRSESRKPSTRPTGIQ